MSTVEVVLEMHDELGEGPLWNVGEQILYWVDIEKGLYHRFHPTTGELDTVTVGGKLGVLGFCQSGQLVLASDSGFALYDPAAKTLQAVGNPEADKPQTRFNDGKVDRAGRFWAGTMGDSFKNSLYRLDADHSIQKMESGIDISNGIGWSPDNRVMYYVDSTPMLIYAYDFDLQTGSIANRRVLVDRSKGKGVPDGMTVDAAGKLWVAIWDGFCVECYDPNGKLLHTIQVPAQNPTSVAFGGAELDEMYITSALCEIPQAERDNHPLDGALFRVKGLAKGLPEPKFLG
jgi:L-arabinonolactonase